MTEYPLQRRFLTWGLGAGLICGVVFMDLLAAFSVAVLFWTMGALWWRQEPPILAFAAGVQWIGIVIGYFFKQITGSYPSNLIPGDVEGAILLSLLALLVLAGGIVAALGSLRDRLVAAQKKLETFIPKYNVRRLFWYVVAIYGINWFVFILPKAVFFNAAEFIYSILEFRAMLLCLLFLVILRQREGYGYGVLAFLFTVIPRFGAKHVEVFEIFFYLLLILLAEWRPWSKSVTDRRRNLRVLLASAGIVISVSYMALSWQEEIKSTWRQRLAEGSGDTPLERLENFISTVQEIRSQYESSSGGETHPGESLAESLWATLVFSHVLERVPAVVPHESGALTLRALAHSFVPRFLFPEKPELGSNSWLVVRYAGMSVAGEEEMTSIGFGYMAEFYVDFGRIGMLIAVFSWGLIVGVAYGALLLVSPSRYFFVAAVSPMFLQSFVGTAEFAYLLGGLMNRGIVYGGLLYAVGPWLHRSLQHRNRRSEIGFQRVVPFRASS